MFRLCAVQDLHPPNLAYNQKYYQSIEQNGLFEKFSNFTYDIDSVTGLCLKDVVPNLYTYMEKK